MKKLLLLAIGVMMSAVAVNAQDCLTKKNGEDVQVIVKEVNADNVKFVLFSEPNGVIYTMPTSDILMIRYASGRNEVFSQAPVKKQNPYMVDYGGGNQIYVGMKYKQLKDIYNYRDWQGGYQRYSPFWCGFGSFFIPGLGQMCSGEFGRGLGHLGVHLGLGLLSTACANTGAETGYYIAALTQLGYDIWTIIDAVRVAKVKNMYETDLRSYQSSVSFEMYPSLNAVPTQSGLGVAPGMTFALTF